MPCLSLQGLQILPSINAIQFFHLLHNFILQFLSIFDNISISNIRKACGVKIAKNETSSNTLVTMVWGVCFVKNCAIRVFLEYYFLAAKINANSVSYWCVILNPDNVFILKKQNLTYLIKYYNISIARGNDISCFREVLGLFYNRPSTWQSRRLFLYVNNNYHN